MRGKKWRMGRGWRGGGGGTSWQECWRWGVTGAGALGGKEVELLAGREALEGLSRHTARNNLNVKHKTLSTIFCCLYALPSKDNLNVNYKRNFTQIVFQNIGVEGFPCYKSVIRAVGLHNVGCPCEQVELEGVQAERSCVWNSFQAVHIPSSSAPQGCSAWTQSGLQERIQTGSTFHLHHHKKMNNKSNKQIIV